MFFQLTCKVNSTAVGKILSDSSKSHFRVKLSENWMILLFTSRGLSVISVRETERKKYGQQIQFTRQSIWLVDSTEHVQREENFTLHSDVKQILTRVGFAEKLVV